MLRGASRWAASPAIRGLWAQLRRPLSRRERLSRTCCCSLS